MTTRIIRQGYSFQVPTSISVGNLVKLIIRYQLRDIIAKRILIYQKLNRFIPDFGQGVKLLLS